MINTYSDVEVNENENNQEHGSLGGIFIAFFLEFYRLLKYIFHDVWLGEPPV